MFITVNEFVIKIKFLYIQKAPYPLTEASDLHDKLVLATRKKVNAFETVIHYSAIELTIYLRPMLNVDNKC